MCLIDDRAIQPRAAGNEMVDDRVMPPTSIALHRAARACGTQLGA